LYASNGFAEFARAAPPPAELLEALGELEEEDMDDMEIMLAEMETEARKVKPRVRPKEVKNEGSK
jgi:hypothetical protein